MRLTAEVRDVETGTVVGSETVEAPVDSLASADRLAIALLQAGLLPVDSEPGELDLARVSTRSFPAFTAYLEGERNYRRGQYDAAAASFVRASELDSTFARAMYRAAQSHMWILNHDLEDEYRYQAARLAARLPGSELSRRDSLLFTGFPYDYSPAAIPNLERFTRMYPDDLDGWFNLGDAYVHLGGIALRPPSDYRRALARAVELGGSYEETHVHLIEDGFARRDREVVRASLDRLAALGGGLSACPGYEFAFTGAWGDDATVAEQVPTAGTSDLSCAWVTLAASGPATEELERRHLDDVATGEASIALFWRLVQARTMRGEVDRALEILDVASAAGFEEWAARNVVMLSLLGLTESSAAAAAVLAAQIPGHSPQTGAQVGSFWLGAKAVEEGRWGDVEPAAQNLESAADTIRMEVVGEGPVRARRVHRFADGANQLAATLRAYAEVMRGGNEELSAFEDELGREHAQSFITAGPAPYLQFRIGLELLERGDPRSAERYLLSLYPYDWAAYVPAQYYLGRVYEELDQPDRAREHYRIFVEWWETADPELQPWVDEGRAALERLVGE
jgi:tetratricopeptide (TPR) repeat protein